MHELDSVDQQPLQVLPSVGTTLHDLYRVGDLGRCRPAYEEALVEARDLLVIRNFLTIGTMKDVPVNRSSVMRPASRPHPATPLRSTATFLAFVTAGAVPLAPYVFSAIAADRFLWSAILSLAVLFAVGAARARVGTGSWWTNGLEMLGLGVLVGAVAYASGVVLSTFLQ